MGLIPRNGVEAWNGIRGLDYLQSRPEVDPERVGVTGAFRGGAYSWWIAALDERVKAAVPVAGITSMRQPRRRRVRGGTLRLHVSGEFRPLGLCHDLELGGSTGPSHFQYRQGPDLPTRRSDRGPCEDEKAVRPPWGGGQPRAPYHRGNKDTQDLRVHAFSWFNRFLKNQNPPPLIDKPAVQYFEPEQLKVFESIPPDEKTSSIHESFVPVAPVPPIPKDRNEWRKFRDKVRTELEESVFGAWPKNRKQRSNLHRPFLRRHPFLSPSVRIPGTLGAFPLPGPPGRSGAGRPRPCRAELLDEKGWHDFAGTYGKRFGKGFPKDLKLPAHDAEAFDLERKMFKNQKWAMAYLAPRGIGPTAWSGDARKRNQILRRFYLLGETLDGMRVFDAVRSVSSLRAVRGMGKVPLWMQANRQMAANLLYASLGGGPTRLA